MYRVVIIEDDPMVASIDKQYIELCGNCVVVGVFKNGREALFFLEAEKADLIILDYYTPMINGLEFVDLLYAKGKMIPIIMVTSANDTAIVQELFARGVLDYLVKPFEFERFKLAMDRFFQKTEFFKSCKSQLDQRAIDELNHISQTTEHEKMQISKGLNVSTLALIRDFLTANIGKTFTSEEIADQVHLSRITIRRYVNHLIDLGEVSSSINYQTGGRPSIHYRYGS